MTLRLPRNTIRLRLTLLYGGMFLASGAVLLTITYLLVQHQISAQGFIIARVPSGDLPNPFSVPPQLPQSVTVSAQRLINAEEHALLVQSGVALGIMALVSIGLGWLLAGRALRPLRQMTATARQISEVSLHRRLAVAGPDDEIKDLADTVDGLLARLETAFDAQRRFVANASHELRTPLTLERTLIEVVLADPAATAATLRDTCQRVLAAGEEQERLIEGLLALARSQRGLDRRDPFDLAALTRSVLVARRPDVDRLGLNVSATLNPAAGAGDPRLAQRLVANLVDNAIGHNVAGGRVEVVTERWGDHSMLRVANTGAVVGAADLPRLFQPFQRLDGQRTHTGAGLGLGLSIVQAIATAHGAGVAAYPLAGGGLQVDISFPAPPDRGDGEGYPSTVTSVPTGVSGQSVPALEMLISTQPSLCGKP